MSVRELVTLASLVEKETASADERPLVAAVYANRLKVGMGLQCDPTVIYALERAGRYTGNLTRADLQFDSPYNTYRYAGLPPGPIAAPGQASLEAAADPADVAYLYFVSRNDGTHAFATTLDEHNRNVFEYQVRYFATVAGRSGPLTPTTAGSRAASRTTVAVCSLQSSVSIVGHESAVPVISPRPQSSTDDGDRRLTIDDRRLSCGRTLCEVGLLPQCSRCGR